MHDTCKTYPIPSWGLQSQKAERDKTGEIEKYESNKVRLVTGQVFLIYCFNNNLIILQGRGIPDETQTYVCYETSSTKRNICCWEYLDRNGRRTGQIKRW